MTIHIGIMGGGNISQTHCRAAREIEGVDIAAFCGQNLERVKRLSDVYGGRAYQNLESFFRHKPMDIVLIGSPSGLHAEQGIAAAKHGLHVLVEKPIDTTVKRADALIVACENAKVKGIGTLEAATSVYPGYPRRLELTWSEGTIIVENDRVVSADLRTPVHEVMGERAGTEDERSTSPVISDVRGHRTTVKDFIRAIETNGIPICDGYQARRSVEVVQAIYESSRTGQAVNPRRG